LKNGCDGDIAGFERKVTCLETDVGRFASEVAALPSAPSDRIPQNLSADVTRLQSDVSAEKATLAGMPPAVQPSPVTMPPAPAPPAPNGPPPPSAARAPPAAPPAVQPSPVNPPPAPAPSLGSVIVSDFPGIFAEFRGKRFQNLWRGSRDGFGASHFHGRCEGHANTLTVILDTDGNIFGGFTPVEWESGCTYKADDSQKSFVFTLKNPHNVAARRFGLKPERKDRAIYGYSERGPDFRHIVVSDNCKANTNSDTYYFGDVYTNDTGLERMTFFTGSESFQVKEIEVFEITD
jgi:hypothetical protein